MSFKVAFYKVNHTGIQGIYSRGVRLWTKTPYSHCELIFSDGMAASASFMDHGVRFKAIEFDPAKWDFIDLPDYLEAKARQWFKDHEGQPYDLLGNLHFVIGVVGDDKNKWFCSEAVAAALGIDKAWRYDPGDLYPILKRISEMYFV
jgi:hypothetical protein